MGNHEFDDGPAKLAPFLNAIQSPLVLANVDLSDEPELRGKFLNSTILTRNGRKIGIIGIIKSDIYVSYGLRFRFRFSQYFSFQTDDHQNGKN